MVRLPAALQLDVLSLASESSKDSTCTLLRASPPERQKGKLTRARAGRGAYSKRRATSLIGQSLGVQGWPQLGLILRCQGRGFCLIGAMMVFRKDSDRTEL